MCARTSAAFPFAKNNEKRTAARFIIQFFILLALMVPTELAAQKTDMLQGSSEEAEASVKMDLYTDNTTFAPVPTANRKTTDALFSERETIIISGATQVIVVTTVAYVAYRKGLMNAGSFTVAAQVETSDREFAIISLSEEEEDDPPPVESEFVREVREVITANYIEDSFGVPELAHQLRLSRSQLFRRLRTEVNVAPSVMIRSYRLEQAREQLREGSLSVKEVTYAVGFRDPATFSRAFRKAYGMPPSSLCAK